MRRFGAKVVVVSAFLSLGCGERSEACAEAQNPYAVPGVGAVRVQHGEKKADKFDIYVEVVRRDGVEIDACRRDDAGTLWRLATAWGRLEGAELPVELSLTDRKEPYFSGFLVVCGAETCSEQEYAMHTDPTDPAAGAAEVTSYSLELGRLRGHAEIDNADATTTKLEIDVNW